MAVKKKVKSNKNSKPTKKVVKKPAKKVVAKKPVKKVAKKVIKKAPPKKAVKKPAAKAKKIIKKPIAKKIVKKPAPKKSVAKKVVKKVAPKKVIAKKPVAKTAKVEKKVEPKKATPAAIKSAPAASQKNNVVSIKSKDIKIAPPKVKEVKIKYVDMTPSKLAKKQGLVKKIELPAGYKPKNDEAYMSPQHLEYFKRKLQDWKKELLLESTETIQHLQSESWNEPDPSDQATIVEQTGLELRTRDRYRKLINKIEAALMRIETGEYGYCEVTGDPIGLARLEARPIATMTIAAQEQHEMEEKVNLES
jgi:DnaK suppressor protein